MFPWGFEWRSIRSAVITPRGRSSRGSSADITRAQQLVVASQCSPLGRAASAPAAQLARGFVPAPAAESFRPIALWQLRGRIVAMMLPSQLKCTHCQAPLAENAVDRAREIATCQNCGRLLDVRSQLFAAQAHPSVSGGAASPPARMRPAVELPRGMSLQRGSSRDASELVIRRRWLRGKHWIFLLVLAGLSTGLVFLWLDQGATTFTIIASLFVFTWDYNVTSMFLNSTSIIASSAGVSVRHGPMPSIFGRNKRIPREQIKQLFAAKYGQHFAVAAHVTDGSTLRLAAPLVTEAQALFVEQQLEQELGLVDFAVEGELNHEAHISIEGKPLAGAKSGAALALAVPAMIAGTLGLFFLMAKTDVAGQLRASEPVGSWQFSPDDCVSGQRQGFAGVVLTSSQTPERRVRLIDDPVKGPVLVVAEQGSRNRVFEADACKVLLIHVARSNTQINDIWAVQGSSTLECPGLSGGFTFDGCH